MGQPTDVVVAGSKAFALALFAPVTERVGTRPRIAVDPAQALALCGASSGLLVVEFDPRWLPALEQLRRQAPGLRIVAALARGQEGAALSLAPLSIEAVPWDGQPAPVIAALERLLGAAPSAAHPAAPAPPGAAPPRPAPQAAPRPAAPPASPAIAPPAPPRPAPAAPVAPAAPRPAPPVPAPVPPRPPPATSPATAPPAFLARPVPAPPPAAQPDRASLDLFDDLAEVPAEPPDAAPAPAAPAPVAAPARYVPPPPEKRVVWPSTIPSAEAAERLFLDAFDGLLAADHPLRGVTVHALAGMSELERGVLTGKPTALEPGPIRRAAVMRLRVGAAIASAPAGGGQVDGAGVEAVLAEIDGLLTQVNALLAQAPDDLKPAVEAIRNVLVKEAVDFGEAAHVAAGAVAAPAPAAEPRPARPQGTRVLSVQGGEAVDQEARESRRGKVVAAMLVLVLLAAGGLHGWRWYQRQQSLAQFPTLRGAPDGMLLLPGPPGTPKVLIPGNSPPDRAQVERFKAEQATLGNAVAEEKGGVLVVTPQGTSRQPGDGRTP